jgi:hypothetical protein
MHATSRDVAESGLVDSEDKQHLRSHRQSAWQPSQSYPSWQIEMMTLFSLEGGS